MFFISKEKIWIQRMLFRLPGEILICQVFMANTEQKIARTRCPNFSLKFLVFTLFSLYLSRIISKKIWIAQFKRLEDAPICNWLVIDRFISFSLSAFLDPFLQFPRACNFLTQISFRYTFFSGNWISVTFLNFVSWTNEEVY